MDVRLRRPPTSPDRAKLCMQPRVAVTKPTTMKRLQIVYYLSRNGHLEHPHFMEITHLPNQPLLLRDVMNRLTALRGKGMPSLYSWSCKRSYKNGYVWNDLAEDDIIYPAEGAEYVLKGSEIVDGCSDRLNQIQINSTRQIQDSSFGSKRRSPPLALTPSRAQHEAEITNNVRYYEQQQEVDYEDEKGSYTSSTTTHSRCSRGVSTEELEESQPQQQQTLKTSPLSTSSASVLNQSNRRSNVSIRFEDGDPTPPKAEQSRNSVLSQLIACGSSAVAKAKSANIQGVVKRESSNSESFRKAVVYKSAAAKVASSEDHDMITYMSENPRFGNLQAEEKEYFSGSIVESMKEDQRVHSTDQPVLKKSNSYNEERSSKAGLGEVTATIEEAEQEERREKAAARGNCIPRKFCSSSSTPSSKQTRK